MASVILLVNAVTAFSFWMSYKDV